MVFIELERRDCVSNVVPVSKRTGKRNTEPGDVMK